MVLKMTIIMFIRIISGRIYKSVKGLPATGLHSHFIYLLIFYDILLKLTKREKRQTKKVVLYLLPFSLSSFA